jgi:hypothetical protein
MYNEIFVITNMRNGWTLSAIEINIFVKNAEQVISPLVQEGCLTQGQHDGTGKSSSCLEQHDFKGIHFPRHILLHFLI